MSFDSSKKTLGSTVAPFPEKAPPPKEGDDRGLAEAAKRKVDELAGLMELGRLRGIDIAFQIQLNAAGKYAVHLFSATKTVKLG